MSAKVAKMAHTDSANARDGRDGTDKSSKKAKTVHADNHDGRDGSEKPAKKARFSHDTATQAPTETTGSTAAATTMVQSAPSERAPVNASKDAASKLQTNSTGANDVLAKAQGLLQRTKDLQERMKKLPIKAVKSGTSAATSAPPIAPTPAVSQVSTVPSPILPIAGGITPNLGGSFNLYGMQPGLQGLLPQGFGGIANYEAVKRAQEMQLGGISNYEAVKRAQELASRWGFQQGPLPILSMVAPPTAEEIAAAAQAKTVKAPVLRLDAHGREVDENGNVVDRPKITSISTLKVNINKQKKEAFKILRPELEEDPVDNPYYDERVGIDKKKLVRAKRSAFQFVEEGKWSKQAEMLRLKSQFGDAKAKEIKMKQAQLSKAKSEADINPNLIEVTERVPVKEEKVKEVIPDVEWWDAYLLPSGSYDDVMGEKFHVNEKKISIYVEHPVPIEPPAEPAPPAPQPGKITKKEQKKLRTQRRLAKEKDRQEMIRQGLLEPPKAKVKMSNLMKVLGAEATQDPTRLEQEIRSAAAEREQAHTDRNLARKLTPAERREKKEKKLFDDPNIIETIVSVYRVNDLSHPQTRFKVDMNAQENRLTGCVVMSDTMTVVVVEGGSKSIKRYSKLMLRRIKWETAVKEDDDNRPEGLQGVNKCVLVWQGSVAKPNFDRFLIQQCRSEAAARKYFADAGVGHYWDLAVNFPED
ncbi:U4/U6 small nuclear ribonucleoprotein PRP3 [Marchantia polymorpha subsp. ruderalis]|uniref:Uncharacterized protein n=2 Tax=Marchantia polymorpha TaxID=3197 RepID=A0A176WE89_MARPO|nr:hypothetical protein AXG93_2018s1200 [Marchantia polymorpha subsp. ruderalis]PTQ45712.1 hypothetical protein MARPO_0014s0207 [Marchantia polymorpha]BBM98014.1 hypothetical protein Mp_1g10190 [Marchantia polymorpha subsp. ruderalis]|eukprot:PTQ45712.1 hypothetical protein MARPO_0014s0207 [Marchantia polymorpha]